MSFDSLQQPNEPMLRAAVLFFLLLFHNVRCELTLDFPRPSNIELIPSDPVVTKSYSTVNFLCINHEKNGSILEYRLTKNISSNELEVSSRSINSTTIAIRLEINDYIGAFHLICFAKGAIEEGTRSDIIVKPSSAGLIILKEKCHVYDRQYLKCIIRAPTIARSLRNDYPFQFEFEEFNRVSDYRIYQTPHELIKNESTDEFLVFKWLPVKAGEYPNGLRMCLKASARYFNTTTYCFDTTPIFRLVPKFSLNVSSYDKIQFKLESIVPESFCERAIEKKSDKKETRTWTIIETKQTDVLFDHLQSNQIYRICVRCRRKFTDPQGEEICQEILTGKIINFQQISPILIIISFFLLGFLSLTLLRICYRRCQQKRHDSPVHTISISNEYHDEPANVNRYQNHEELDFESERDDDCSSTLITHDAPATNDSTDSTTKYLPLPESIQNLCWATNL